ncbi:response regulator [Arcobacter arenosus]|jgi:CheY-like chemotaxis protein|uniref:Response regulator n=1 Tax=Arcobacter arenosus TaxID=2576037 RepID=A0A5R8XX01_9BACT|nr:response regulator [Arcobacter arenosus]TLP35191.1 response regulator [Arcobacter arenosus]
MEKFNILIVDDIKANLFSLNLLLDNNFDNINVIEATSVKDSIKQIMKHNVDLVLTDIQMPEASGYDLAEYLLDIEETKDIPIIMISGIYEDDIYKKKAYNSSKNVVDFITKPIDDELLVQKLKAFINIISSMKENKIKLEQKELELQRDRKISNMLGTIENHFDSKIELDEEEVYEYLIKEDDLINLDDIIKK